MTPTLIVLLLLALAVGIVVWATRKKPARPYEERQDQDTAWNDPITPATADPFAAAPPPEPSAAVTPVAVEAGDDPEPGVSDTTREPTPTDRPLL